MQSANRLIAGKENCHQSFLLATRRACSQAQDYRLRFSIFLDFYGTLEMSFVLCPRLYGRNISTS